MIKISGKEVDIHSGPAKVFDSEYDGMRLGVWCIAANDVCFIVLTAIREHKIVKGDVVIIRYEGPRGGPGMREQLAPSAALVG